MKPPFLGTKVVKDIPLDEIEPLIDRDVLFVSRWQLRQGVSQEEWENVRRIKAIHVFEKLMAQCRAKPIIEPAAIYGFFKCEKRESALFVEDEGKAVVINFPRQHFEPHRCVADLFKDGFVAVQIATVGMKVVDEAAKMFSSNSYSDAFYLKGLASEAAEAAAEWCMRRIRNELGAPEGTGKRYSPGMPAFPDLFAQKKLFGLLKPARIGMKLTQTCHMVPEYATTAIVSFDPSATYFRP